MHPVGGRGAGVDLAAAVRTLADSPHAQFRTLYDDGLSRGKRHGWSRGWSTGPMMSTLTKAIRDQFEQYQRAGYGHFPSAWPKPSTVFSTDPGLLGAPVNHRVRCGSWRWLPVLNFSW